MTDGDASSGVRLAEVLAALSVATDLGLGQPVEHMLRSTLIAMRLGDRLNLDPAQMQALYDVSLLTYVGCPIYGNEAAAVFGDDIQFRSRVREVDLVGVSALRFMLSEAGAGGSVLQRARAAGGIVATAGRTVATQMANHCAAAGVLAEELRLGNAVREGLEQTYARWDGKGVPGGLGGDQLSLAARVAHVAEAAEAGHRVGGVEGALELATARCGSQFDPAVVEVLQAEPGPLFANLEDATLEAVLDAEPVARPALTDNELDEALGAIGDFYDLRCPYFAGHARGTAELASIAGAAVGLPDKTVRLLRRAAFVHDMGRAGVPGSVWDKPGPLNATEQERMRLHAYLVERMFSRPDPLKQIGTLAAAHHERMDGSGYHRGLAGALISFPARIIAAADAYHAMRQHRPHRAALDRGAASRELRAEASAGRLDMAAVEAVLEAAGDRGRSRTGGPASLTGRELEVLALLAEGAANKTIARTLGISPKTVSNHIEHIYTKIGASSRAAAALYAMRNGLVGPEFRPKV